MNGQPSVLALRPGAKLSKADRATLKEVGIVVVRCAAEDLVSIRSVSILPANEMLRYALQAIESANMTAYNASANRQILLAELGKRLIEAYLAYGQTTKGTPLDAPSPSPTSPAVTSASSVAVRPRG